MSKPRKTLCVSPRYARSFGTFDHAFPLIGVKGFMPPQGILVVAAWLPSHWQVRVIDENVRAVSDEDLRWADAVFVSGMHVQRHRINTLTRRAQAQGKLVVLGGPSVSASPQWYPEPDILHVGELGDGTEQLIMRLDQDARRPVAQEVYRTTNRLSMDRFPVPAYDAIDVRDYFLAAFSTPLAALTTATSVTFPSSMAAPRGPRHLSRSPPSSTRY
ncbi:cobalamin-dependent protein [Streptomyces flavidovirens]|uniref:cobalamin-dependent protein n=1 Tax=Streptomyces flavidovirens TaxID=67298 RepID=UPI00048FF363|nr:cobalamin-dependent protein [Streptomyces flavidovirens]